MLRYQVKPEYSFGEKPYMKGTLALLEYKPQTRQYLIQNNRGQRVMVTQEYFEQCMEPIKD